jgi:hypothetical protein
MAKSGKKKKSAPIVKVRLRGCPDEQSFIEHVLDRFTIGGLRLRTKADPAIGSKLRVVYQLEDGETVFHALCLVAGTSPPRDGKRTLDLRFRRMGRSSKDIYDAILEAQKLRVRGEEAQEGDEGHGRADQPTPRDVSTVPSEEKDASADSGRGQLPTPVSGVRAFPDEQDSNAESDEEAPDDATPVEGIDRQAEVEGSIEDEQPPKKKRLSSELTTEEVLQLEDDEILDVDEDEQGDEDSAAADIADEDEDEIAAADIVNEEDEDEDEDELAAADIVDEEEDEDEDEDELAAADIIDEEEDEDEDAEAEGEDDDSVAAKAQEHTDEVPTADIVAEDEEEPAAEIAAESSEDEPPAADIVEEDEDDDLMEAEVFDDEDLIDEETLDVEELDDDLEQSFDEMFDDLGDMLFSDEEEKKDLHQAPTEETDTVYTQPPPGPPTTEGEKKEDDEAYDILKDAFEFASSDSTPEKEKPRDGSRLRLASASYQAVPDETAEDEAEDEAPEVVEEEKVGSRPSDAYDIVKDAFEFASSDSEPTESKERDASTLRLASAAYQAVPDEAVDGEGEEEDTRTSEEQEKEALEALARQKERSGPRPIVGPAVRKKKKGFFERLFNNDE